MQALHHDADVVVMLHPDGQYEPGLIPTMVAPIVAGEADLVLGSRLAIPGAAIAAGMPRWKWVANRFLTTIQNRIMGTNLTEAHTGYRAYSRELLLTVPFLRNSLDFSFDSELLYQAAEFGFRIAEVPARCRYFEDMSSVGFKTGVVYGLKTLWAGVRLILHRAGIWPLAQVPALEPPAARPSSRGTSSRPRMPSPRATVRRPKPLADLPQRPCCSEREAGRDERSSPPTTGRAPGRAR